MQQQQIVRLVCATHGMSLVSPRMGRSYALKHFLNDVKVSPRAIFMYINKRHSTQALVVTCGVDNQPAALLLEDHHLQGLPGMLGVVNALLGEASMPGLFAHEELEGLLLPLRDAASAEGCVYVCISTDYPTSLNQPSTTSVCRVPPRQLGAFFQRPGGPQPAAGGAAGPRAPSIWFSGRPVPRSGAPL